MKRMHKIVICMIFLVGLMITTNYFTDSLYVSAATISKKKMIVKKGKTATLTVKGTKKKPKWYSSNKKYVTVKASGRSGKVKGVKGGVANITAKIGKKKYKCNVTVPRVALGKFDLVDSGKHLDVDGNSKYMSYVWKGKDVWNTHKKGVVRKDSITVVEDVYCKDYSKKDGTSAYTSSAGEIYFNKKYMDQYGADRKKNTATHELGHALGLGHNTKRDIMYKNSTTRLKLSINDKYSYNAAYKRY